MTQLQTTEGASETVESIVFSFMTGDDVRNLSFKKITSPIGFDATGSPIPDGVYDPELGPLDEVPCKSCGQLSFNCPGHCGHIDLVQPVYNPLSFKALEAVLNKTCFFCYHFRCSEEKVKEYKDALNCLVKGDIVGAGRKRSSLSFKSKKLMEDEHSSGLDATQGGSRNFEVKGWTSVQHNEIKAVLRDFMHGKITKCKRCQAKNPTLKVPTFGWFRMDMAAKALRGNIIGGHKLDVADADSHIHPLGEVLENNEDMFARSSLVDHPKKGKKDKQLAEHFRQKEFFSREHLLPIEVKYILERLYENEGQFCQLIFDLQMESSMRGESKNHLMFFIDALLVPPNKFRPPTRRSGGDSIVEHPQTTLLSKVLQSSNYLRQALVEKSEYSYIIPRWINLQLAVNSLFDSRKAAGAKGGAVGICQLLEKKEGIFRQKMMGKRVNFSCRSVISPDPYLAVNEIGIPPCFALKLTYPERVTPWNVDKLRNAVINGSEVHPGATHYTDKLGAKKLLPQEKYRRAVSRKLLSSRGGITNPGKAPEMEFEGKFVSRHLQDGDIVLVNRQPTLHKPSMMAHVVRVLKGEKTLRMHYANCSTYNADFDGDEINVHFPQDEISRAEAYNIANANKQYTVPTSGDPIRGLIQDHIVSAVLLTKKDTFLTRDEYHQLLYASCGTSSSLRRTQKRVCTVHDDDEMQPLPPAIWKPTPLWTGKQVISTILNHVTKGCPPFTVKKDGRIPGDYFGRSSGEGKLLVQRNELIHGVIDKAQFGKYGLVHAVQELYGSDAAGRLLSIFSRLFTVFLQMHGFTCGVDDLLVSDESDLERVKRLKESDKFGEQVHYQFVGGIHGSLDPVNLQAEIEKMVRTEGESATATLDRMMCSVLNRLTSEVNKMLIPRELWKPFPRNCLALMTTTGAKGSLVNFTQISSLLGQQELEGKRVPRMVSGKTLPCFRPWDTAARAGGFIADRFLTGLRPQEYYFHCMAGRDGLVDTAVKTSRSGYLQRCLIKSLESLKVCYDHTVRDSDGSVIQFVYGDDGVDVHKTSYLSEFKMLASNKEILEERWAGQLEHADSFKFNSYVDGLPEKLEGKANNFIGGLKQKKKELLQHQKTNNFLKLVKLKYISSLAQPGEAVGVLAAQSVGEPSTQMTLNTFHFAGQGEMNVTLGIPRLQEILMKASERIKTPVMECPFKKGRTKDDAERLAAQLRKVTLADVIESMEVSTLPFSVYRQQVCAIYKLTVKLYPPELYPADSNITLENCQKTLESTFVGELASSIESHVEALEKMRGITDVSDIEEIGAGNTEGGDEPESKSKAGGDGGDDGEGDAHPDDGGKDDDFGVDAEKRRRQATDEMDYDDDFASEISTVDKGQGEEGFEREVDQVEADDDYNLGGREDDADQIRKVEDEAPMSSVRSETVSNEKEKEIKTNMKRKGSFNIKKGSADSLIFVEMQGLHFEVHFQLTDKPHFLLAQIAQQTARRVLVKSSGNIERCSVVEDKANSDTLALQTAGVNFNAFWAMQDDLDVNYVKSNDIHAMLMAYGVEAARATIINEVRKVFDLYGISVNIRHLSLIADYMTADGGYLPMSRHGMEKKCTSPFNKITFETATRFIVEAALHGEVDRLDSSSSRVALGLPVRLGTGCFDVMQNLQVK